jgi:cardiolipin synthase
LPFPEGLLRVTLRQLPNLITVLRIVLVLPIGWAIVTRRDELALVLAAVAGLSDALDGFLARHYGWQSRLGAWLDPAADKLMLMVAYLSLAWIGVTPWWLTALVLLRDVVIVAGALAYRWLRGALEVAPSRISKINTTVQIIYVLLVLFNLQGALTLEPAPMAWLVAALTLASGIDYVVRFATKAARKDGTT